jgi:hypothetical protein
MYGCGCKGGKEIVEKDTRNRAWTTSTGASKRLLATVDSRRLKKVETFVDDVESIGRIGTI